MSLVLESRTLLGFDVAGSARNPGYHSGDTDDGVTALLTATLRDGGIGTAEILEWEQTHDGAMLTLPGSRLGSVLDAAVLLDTAVFRWNQRRNPELRIRIAVESGSVGDGPGYHSAKRTIDRMLNADRFKTLFAKCRAASAQDEVNSALIVSDQAKQAAFYGDHTRVSRIGEFALLPLRCTEYVAESWVRVPGFDARTIETLMVGEDDRSRGDEADGVPRSMDGGVSNIVYGNVHGVQAGVINGGVVQNSGR